VLHLKLTRKVPVRLVCTSLPPLLSGQPSSRYDDDQPTCTRLRDQRAFLPHHTHKPVWHLNNMQTSRYFERTLFSDRSPAADEYYLRSASLIFEKNPAHSVIEVRVQSSSDFPLAQDIKGSKESEFDATLGAHFKMVSQEKPERDSSHAENSECKNSRLPSVSASDDEDACSLSSKTSSTAVGLDEQRGGSPPLYPGMPQLAVVTLGGDIRKLKDFIKVSQMTVIQRTPLKCCAQQTNRDFRVLYVALSQTFAMSQYAKELITTPWA
jgi:hypothetical protein